MLRRHHFRLKAQRVVLTENDVERACLDLLRARGYWTARLHAGTFRTTDGKRWIKGVERGTPDYAALHARFPGFLLEVKRPGAEPTPEQKQKHEQLRLWPLAVATADTVEALARWLDEHEGRTKCASDASNRKY